MWTHEKKPLSKIDSPIQQSRPQRGGGALSMPDMAALVGNQAMLAYLGGQSDQSKPAATGEPLSDALRKKFERKSGVPLDDVRVHYNSDKPEQLGAEAYAQGNEIHIGPGNEQDLEHEVGHVVQQKHGIVKPTGKEMGCPINTSPMMELKADAGVLANKQTTKKVIPVIQFSGRGGQFKRKHGGQSPAKIQKRKKRYDRELVQRVEEERQNKNPSKHNVTTVTYEFDPKRKQQHPTIYVGVSRQFDGSHPRPETAYLLDKLTRSKSQCLHSIDNCGEFNAINAALLDRRKFKHLKVYSVKTRTGEHMEPCQNCSHLYGKSVDFVRGRKRT
ncbi:MAG: DUF4157 domain-containing protein [Clostridia bacterium]|nr:DUF4157 domain-containing protein [Clostridia bacterium]